MNKQSFPISFVPSLALVVKCIGTWTTALFMVPPLRGFSRTQSLKAVARQAGADLAGIADLASLRPQLPVVPEGLLDDFRYAEAVAVRLDQQIVGEIADQPTPEYAQHYREVNERLDAIAKVIACWIVQHGFRAHAHCG